MREYAKDVKLPNFGIYYDARIPYHDARIFY